MKNIRLRAQPTNQKSDCWTTALRGTAPIWALGWFTVTLAFVLQAHMLPSRTNPSTPQGLQAWDLEHYLALARSWYAPSTTYDEAFMPGLPALIRTVGFLFGGRLTVAAVLIGAVSSFGAGTLLWRWVASRTSAVSPRQAVALLLLNPMATFLYVPYTESLLLVCVLAALLAADRDRWLLVGGCVAAAVLVRVTGLSLLLAVAVILAQRVHRDGMSRRAGSWAVMALGPAVAAWVGWMSYLRAQFGTWTAQVDAWRLGWGRTPVDPFSALLGTIRRAETHPLLEMKMYLVMEAVALLVGLAAAVCLARQRDWPMTAYVGSAFALLSTSSYYGSCLRALLVMPPIIVLAAGAAARWGAGARTAAVSVPLLLTHALFFFDGAVFLG